MVGTLAEDVIDDLNAEHARIFDRLQRLLDQRDADAVSPDLPGFLQFIETSENLRSIENFGRRAMKLDQIQAFDAEVLQAAIDEAFEIGLGIAVGHMRAQPSAGLGRHHWTLTAARLQDIGNDLFRAAIAIDVGGVDEGHAGIEGGVQRCAAIGLADIAPRAADLPGPEADIRHDKGRPSKSMMSHEKSPLFHS